MMRLNAIERPDFPPVRLPAKWCAASWARWSTSASVVAFDAARVARNNRAWHHVIDWCALTAPLLLAADGLSDPRQRNERFVWGMQGSSAA
jgi:hypothetical protein